MIHSETELWIDQDSPIERLRDYELEEARQLQCALLPDLSLILPRVEFASWFCPLFDVGGDFVDYFRINDERAGIYMGDVVGKGLPAAMYAALMVGAFRGLDKATVSPGAALELLNRRVRLRSVRGRYCAAHFAVLDIPTGLLTGANAGIPHPLHISSTGTAPLGAGGIPIALVENSTYEEYSVKLRPGDSVLFMTDGLLDARNPEGEEFGRDRLVRRCAKDWNLPPQELLRQILHDLEEFGGVPHDDVTLTLLHFRKDSSSD